LPKGRKEAISPAALFAREEAAERDLLAIPFDKLRDQNDNSFKVSPLAQGP